MKIWTATAIAVSLALVVPGRIRGQPTYRSFTVDATEVTQPALAVMPDGRALILTALGHLFQPPVEGGAATQLTFGPSWDSDPAISPDGRRVAFTSNRDGSGANVFHPRPGQQASHAVDARDRGGSRSWSPDGRTIAYARNIPHEEHALGQMPGFGDTGLRELRTVPAPTWPANMANASCACTTFARSRPACSIRWVARPHFSHDGRWVYFTNRPGKLGTFYRIALEPGASPEALTDLSRQVNEGLVSPDGRWLAATRRSGLRP